METKTVHSKFQDILLGVKTYLATACVICSILVLTYQTTIAGNYFSQAALHTVITFHANDNNPNIEAEAVLSDLVQSGIIYLPNDTFLDGQGALANNSGTTSSYKVINTKPIMINKLYNHILEKSQNYLKIEISDQSDEDKDPNATATKEPIYLVTSENIAGKLPDNNFSKIGTADVDFSNGSHFTFDVYISDETLSGYDNNGISSILNVYKQDISINAFPNPAKDILNINIAGNLDQIEDITIINLIGVNVMKIKNTQLHQSMQLNVSSLPQGIYYLSVRTESEQAILQRINILN